MLQPSPFAPEWCVIIRTMNNPEFDEKSQNNRDNAWLRSRLEHIWQQHFSDVARLNEIHISFGRKSRTRLGSIGMDGWKGHQSREAYRSRQALPEGTSLITITGYFTNPLIPEYVIDATIGHELVHYVHGFHSPHPQRYANPHQGGIVDKEMVVRGMGHILAQQKSWLKQEWEAFIGPPTRRRRRRRIVRLPFLRSYRRT